MGDIAHQKEIPSTHEPESIHRPSSTFKPTTDSAPMTTSPSSLSEKAVNINRSLDNVCQMNTNIDMLKKKTESVQEDLDSLRNCVFQQQQLIERIAAIVPDSKDTNTERSRKMIQQDIHHVRQMLLSTQMHSLDLSQSKPCEQSTSKNKSDALKITSLIHSSSPKNKRWANHLFYDSTSSDSSSSKKK
ncbi:hypothetical protein BDF14DRAFT_91890 [Spinellus fusiger]|nr:hypothetical protein BDF14DRAFT_91890 [Spinellus fusiger]